jgi:predicted DCC family thiol-disulfide oxidoreductase YuxK
MAESEALRGSEKKPLWVFYYDGDCGFCSRVVQVLGWLDFGKGVRWVPFQSLEEPPPGKTWDDLDSAAYLDCGEGDLEEGFYAFRRLTIKIPVLIPLAPVFWFPGMRFLGVPAYRWVARNRYRISRCGLPAIKSNKTPRPPGG